MPTYIAILSKDPDTDYGVHFPDFPGCVTAGSTLEEVKAMAAEVLPFHIEGMLEDGEAIPAPSSLEQVLADPDNRVGLPILVQVPDEVLRRADRPAAE
ncbi:MAG TPA: type II toxin-antitoxin system HicB family antitoxin [Azospirillaceae bacterium]|nr:type II toxin-antitoxin system HicB family antitoxin [Azospirillaceae bacterium]